VRAQIWRPRRTGRSRATEDAAILTQANTAQAEHDSSGLSAHWRQPGDVATAEWRALHDRALEPNPFYTPEVVRAAADHLPDGARLRLLAIYRGGRLSGLFPLVADRRRYVVPLPLLRAGDFYGPLSTPLLDPEGPEDIWLAMLDLMEAAGVRGLLLPFLTEGGAAERALLAALGRSGRIGAVLARYGRAMLRSDLSGADYVRATLETRRRKEADRQRRRLAEQGELVFRLVRAPSDIGPALEAFLDLEASGWKGRRGTDLKHAQGAADFIRAAVRGLAERDAGRVGILSSGGRVVAAGIVVLSGTRAYYIKTAYDEAFARYSPGLLLTLDLTRHLLDDPGIADADSVAVAGHPMIDPLWTARQPIISLLVAARPGADPVFRLVLSLEKLREKLRVSTARIRAAF